MSDEAFARHRGLLFTVAYEILGSAADAEDVLQDSWLRWSEMDRAQVRDPRAYLVRVVTRQALNRLRTLQRRRESYVGPWLPEPLLTAPDVVEHVELADSVSLAMLLVLDTLGPTERAVFVLREVFGFGYDEIAAAVDRSEPAVRQIASRARAHVQERRPRRSDEVDRELVVARFLEAAAGGDLQSLMDALAPDVVLLSDGGGRVSAARRPVVGRDNVLRFLAGLARKAGESFRAEPVHVNGEPGARILLGGQLAGVMLLRFDGALVTQVYWVGNPDKLGRLRAGVPLGAGDLGATARDRVADVNTHETGEPSSTES